MAQRYNPPKQGAFGQVIDVLTLLALVFAALYIPVTPKLQPKWLEDYFAKVAVGRHEVLPEGVSYTFKKDDQGQDTAEKIWTGLSWDKLGQNPTMQAQWEKLGYSQEQAADIITQPFDYTIDVWGLLQTALVILLYYVFVLWASKREYREVIREKFE